MEQIIDPSVRMQNESCPFGFFCPVLILGMSGCRKTDSPR